MNYTPQEFNIKAAEFMWPDNAYHVRGTGAIKVVDMDRTIIEVSFNPYSDANDRNKVIEKMARAGYDFYIDRKSTRLNSSHTVISYAVFCLKKKKTKTTKKNTYPT